MRKKKGKIASWNDDKGFGFITPLNGGDRVFIHIKAFRNRGRPPEQGEIVSYSIDKDGQGRTRAVNARLAGDKLSKKSKYCSGSPEKSIALLFFSAIGVSVHQTNLPLLVFGAYLLMSTITFIAYAIDKSAAQAGRWRTSEATLHLLGLMGGWPGALLAQQILRHKSKKTPFKFIVWITVILNCAGFAWLHSADGRAVLERLPYAQTSELIEFLL
jgi:uncharacterized membrane protein YsdA (DUF1294 family)/cold shock CspA family protein